MIIQGLHWDTLTHDSDWHLNAFTSLSRSLPKQSCTLSAPPDSFSARAIKAVCLSWSSWAAPEGSGQLAPGRPPSSSKSCAAHTVMLQHLPIFVGASWLEASSLLGKASCEMCRTRCPLPIDSCLRKEPPRESRAQPGWKGTLVSVLLHEKLNHTKSHAAAVTKQSGNSRLCRKMVHQLWKAWLQRDLRQLFWRLRCPSQSGCHRRQQIRSLQVNLALSFWLLQIQMMYNMWCTFYNL